MAALLRNAIIVGAVMWLGTSVAHAQNKPFPQNVTYAHGLMTSKITSTDAKAVYDVWKQSYLKTDCGSGYARVEFNNPAGTTVSEGMGYGMVLAVYHADKTAFDGLWKFAQKNMNSDGLMGWKVDCNGPLTQSGVWGDTSATDGDLDIGFALVAAVDQWGDAYRSAATNYVTTLKNKSFQTCSQTGRVVAKNGNSFGGCADSNSSYWMPGYYRVFAEFSGDKFWNDAANSVYPVFLANRNATTGFISNELDQYGNIANGQNQVDYNGCRIPWRLAADYLWYGTADAKTLLDKLTGWAAAQGISNLVDGYLVDGTRKGSWTRANAWTGGWACGAVSSTQSRLDQFAVNFKTCGQNDDYYSTSLRSLYMLMLSGNFWKPGTPPSTNTGTGGSGNGSGGTGTGGKGTGGSGATTTTGGQGSGAQNAGGNANLGGAAGGANADPSASSSGCACRQARTDDGVGGALVFSTALMCALSLVRRRTRRSF